MCSHEQDVPQQTSDVIRADGKAQDWVTIISNQSQIVGNLNEFCHRNTVLVFAFKQCVSQNL